MNASAYQVVADLSGGKDSIAMALMLVERGERVDDFIAVDTGFDLPEAHEAIARFETLSGRTVTRLCPPRDFLTIAAEIPNGGKMERESGYGWPSFSRRWCNYELKRRVLSDYDREHGFPTHLVGIAADETKRLKAKRRVRYPLAEWDVTEAECLSYCLARGFYASGVYAHRARIGCFFCPFQRVSDVRWLRRAHPELWERVKQMESVIGEPWKGRGTGWFEKEDA